MEKQIFYFKEDVRNVTGFYYEIIKKALINNGHQVIALTKHKDKATLSLPKSSYFLVTSLNVFFYLYLHGFRNFIYWFQGITPEEDFLFRKSYVRRFIFSKLEKLALVKVRYKICVSKYQIEHYQKKYAMTFLDKSIFVMPCFNSEFCRENFFAPSKYKHNTFCYAGGLQPWQGFDLILKLYKEIEDKYTNTFLKIFSKDLENAKRMLDEYNIKNYSVECVKPENMAEALSDCKFGFLLRDDNIINQVATPTKLATYIGNGVIPIFSDSIRAYSDMACKYEHLYCMNFNNYNSVIELAMGQNIIPHNLEREFYGIMNKYFCSTAYMDKLQDYLQTL